MAATFQIPCPQCKQKITASEQIRGKKVRCKGCAHVFAIPAAPPKPTPDEDEDDIKSYGITEADQVIVHRCPHCAEVLESEDTVICIHCGYNTTTRQRMKTEKSVETTSQERLAWLAPGFGAIAGILLLIMFDLFFTLKLPKMVKTGEDMEFFTGKGVQLWTVILSLIGMFFLGKFAVGRLILNPTPPEKIK